MYKHDKVQNEGASTVFRDKVILGVMWARKLDNE